MEINSCSSPTLFESGDCFGHPSGYSLGNSLLVVGKTGDDGACNDAHEGVVSCQVECDEIDEESQKNDNKKFISKEFRVSWFCSFGCEKKNGRSQQDLPGEGMALGDMDSILFLSSKLKASPLIFINSLILVFSFEVVAFIYSAL